jgi:hypothetical protein|nr:hypothetical protein [Pseudomonas sp. Bi130]
MTKPFDMEPFLSGVLTGSHSTRTRHIRQAKIIQAAIVGRWRKDNPWRWQRKYLVWVLNHYLQNCKGSTRYYYRLTIQLIALRLGRSWSQASLETERDFRK